MKTLVVYYTQTNSSKEVSEYIKSHLTKNDWEVDTANITDSPNLSQYECIILGGPIHGMNLATELKTYINNNRSILKDKKVALYNVSYTYYNGRKLFKKAIANSFKKLDGSVRPIATASLGGKIDKEMPLPARVIFGLKKGLDLDQWRAEDADVFIEQIKKAV